MICTKSLDHQNLFHSPTKINKSYCGTKHLIKKLFKKYKRKIGQWINDNKVTFVKISLQLFKRDKSR